MPNWKKVIVSGSDAALNSLNVTTNVVASSFTGSLFGTASYASSSSTSLTASFVNPLRQTVQLSGSLLISSSAAALQIQGSGSSVFSVDGTSGRLFSVDDSLSGSLFSVNTAAGLPVMEAFSDNTIRMGQFGQKALFISSSRVGIGKETPLNANLDISGSAVITGSLIITGSVNTIGINSVTGSANISGSANITGSVGISGSLVMAGHISASVNGIYNLGIASSRFANIYANGNLYVGGGVRGTSLFLGDEIGNIFLKVGSLATGGNIGIYGSGSIYTDNGSRLQVIASGSQNALYVSGSSQFTGSVNVSGSITSTGTITAQTLVVQTVTSSVEFVTGSTRNGSLLANTHQFTGSVLITGSLQVNGSDAILSNQTSSMSVATASYALTASYSNNSTSASYAATASYASNVPETASYALAALTASHALTAPYSGLQGTVPTWNQDTTGTAATASYVVTAQTASYVLNAVSASYWSGSILNATSASYAVSSSYAATASYATNITISGSINDVDYIDFQTGSDQPIIAGRLGWDDGNGTLALGLKGGNVTLQVGEETVARVFNADSVTLTDGMIVYISGSQGNRIAVKRAAATAELGSSNTIGMVTEPITAGSEGFVTTFGVVNGLNTIGLTPGAPLWLSTASGEFTQTKPNAPYHNVLVGYVQRVHASVGSIYVKIDNGYELDELHNVVDTTTTGSYGDLLVRSGSVWTNSKQLSGSYGLTGSLQATSFTGSLSGTASYASFANTSSNAATASSADNFTVRGTLTAQTIVAQTITSSIDFVTGSTRFGSLLANTHSFTGSVGITGSVSMSGDLVFSPGNTHQIGSPTLYPTVITTSTSRAAIFRPLTTSGFEYRGFDNVNVIGRWFNNGNLSVQSGSALTDNGYRLQVNGYDAPSGSLYVSGSSVFTGSVSITGSLSVNSNLTVNGTSAAVPIVALNANGATNNNQYFDFRVSTASKFQFGYTQLTANRFFIYNSAISQDSFKIFESTNNILIGYNSATTDTGFKLDVTGSTRLNGSLTVSSSLIQSQNTSSLASGLQTISTNATASYTAAFYNYTLASGSNTRAGQFVATWNGTSIEYMDNSTFDIGNTSTVALTASLSGANVLLTSTLPSTGWTIKTLVNLI